MERKAINTNKLEEGEMAKRLVDTSIFQGIVEFEFEGVSFRCEAQGAGMHGVFARRAGEGAFERIATVRVRKPSTTSLLHAIRGTERGEDLVGRG